LAQVLHHKVVQGLMQFESLRT